VYGVIRKDNATLGNFLQYARWKQDMNIAVDRGHRDPRGEQSRE
jgi:hypothetical protein